ncbi:MAG: hypothetical protein FJ387_01750 [Verrucomicrobia bacterium]|nr:hypothetical protein [Verrucomicrobiota bacterium]
MSHTWSAIGPERRGLGFLGDRGHPARHAQPSPLFRGHRPGRGPVRWSGKHNTISCPAGHHFYEGRWLRDPQYLDDYAVFWFRKGGELRRYSFWAADALWARHLVQPNAALLANLLNGPPQEHISVRDYFATLKTYAKSHRFTRDDGRVVPWIDENLNPFTGDWISRTRLKAWKDGTWDTGKGGPERGKDYNHSTFCDLVIRGLVGLRPRADRQVEVHPLVPPGEWDWFCLDGIAYRVRTLTILWDQTGAKYGKGAGMRVFADGQEIVQAPKLQRVMGELP